MHGRQWRQFPLALLILLAGLLSSPLAGAQTYSSECSGCHGPTPIGTGRVNAAGAVSVINVANTVNGMGTNSANWSAVAADIATLVPTTLTTSVAYGSSGNVITVPNILVAGSSVLNTLAQVSGPTVSFAAGSNNITYNHTAGTCSQQTIVMRGTGPAVAATGGTVTPITSNRTITVNITPPAAPTATNSTSNIAYSTSPIAIPLTLGGGPASAVTITSALNPAVGTLNVAGTSVTYTASASQYASTVTFSYQATGPTGCGTASGTATVTINVGPPPAPTAAAKSVTVQSNTSTPIDLTASVTGISTGVSVATPPAHGAAVASGYVITYTPTTNYSGPDTFTYVANGPGGASTPATVTINVTAAPLVANKSVTVPYQTATPIDLTSSITGSFTSISVASGPSHGSTSVSGAVVTYTPAAGYSGPDSFTYTATGSGGTSTPATVSITVNPPAPTVTNRTVSVASFATNSIDLATSISGSYTSIAIASPPAHGSVSVTGPSTVSYTPVPGYIGPDSFTFTATGVGGTSAPATVTLNVQPPSVPTASNLSYSIAFETEAILNLATGMSGVFSAAQIVTQPSHGSIVFSGTGTVIRYTPAPGYFGTDTFTYAAVGLGGTSAPATVTLTIGTPGAPVVSARTVGTAFNTAVTIDLSGAVSGLYTSLAIATPPAHGTATLSGNIVTYTPARGYTGPDSFTFTATGPGGTSEPATVSITISTQPPIAAATSMTVALNGSASVDLGPLISGSAITGVAISVAPAHGTVAVNGTKVTYTPAPNFFGSDSFAYVAFGNAGTSPPAVISVTVIGRPDPTKDPNVQGIIGAQGASAQRFARAQIGNFQQRLEALHGQAAEPSQAAAGTTRSAEASFDARRGENAPVQLAAAGGSGLTGPIPSATNSLSAALANSFLSLATSQAVSIGANGSPGFANGTSVWIAGSLRFGHHDPAGNARTRFTTDGVSAGVDKRFGNALTLGIGAGFARDKTDIGVDGSNSDAKGTAFAAYGSFHPGRGVFVDGLVGFASLDLDTNRFVGGVGDYARSSRKGDQWFASLSAGYEHRHEGLLLSPYGRLDYASTRLKQATETGAGVGALVYFEQTVPMFQGSLGVRAESQHDTRFGSVRPRAKIEFTHDFENDRDAQIAYADQFGTRYSVTPGGVKRNSLLLGIGSDFNMGGGLKLGLDYQARRSSRADVDQGIRLQLTQELDGKGPARWFGWSNMFEDPVRVEASYTWDDNLTRARDARDKLSDHIFGVNVAKGRVFPLSTHTRVVSSAFVSAEDLYRYSGLARASGGVQAELQYRPSGDFDAITLGLLGRASGDYYDSSNRRGFRYSVALTARRSLTDRIEAFAAITGNARYARSAVFDQKDYGAKLNLDYALTGTNGSIYLSGEYRRGDTASSGRFALENIDIADVFTPDEAAFGPGFFAYRFEAKTWLGTLGYNRPLGPRDALDISWRRAQSTPLERPGFYVPGPFRYIDNQYSIVYLMRF